MMLFPILLALVILSGCPSTQAPNSAQNGITRSLAANQLTTKAVLYAGESLQPDEALVSSDGYYKLSNQSDGNLVIYGPNGVVWASNTAGRGPATLAMQGDCNLVLYFKNGSSPWASSTVSDPSIQCRVQLQGDGNLVIYDKDSNAIWATGADTKNNRGDFSYAIMGDPNYPWAQFNANQSGDWTVRMNEAPTPEINAFMAATPGKGKGGSWTDAQTKASAYRVNGWQAAAIRSVSSTGLAKAELVVINGDMTAYGRSSQFKEAIQFYVPQNLGIPAYWSLGNHDIQNNINDCWADVGETYYFTTWGNNGCAAHMRDRMKDFIRANNFEYDTTGQNSLAYSWTKGNYRFIQTHNYPGYTANKINMGSSIPWVEQQALYATQRGEGIVILMHNPRGFGESFIGNDMKRIIANSNVVALFAAHEHDLSGFRGETYPSKVGTAPMIWSGSPMWSRFMHVNFGLNQFTLSVINSTNGSASVVNTQVFRFGLGVPSIGSFGVAPVLDNISCGESVFPLTDPSYGLAAYNASGFNAPKLNDNCTNSIQEALNGYCKWRGSQFGPGSCGGIVSPGTITCNGIVLDANDPSFTIERYNASGFNAPQFELSCASSLPGAVTGYCNWRGIWGGEAECGGLIAPPGTAAGTINCNGSITDLNDPTFGIANYNASRFGAPLLNVSCAYSDTHAVQGYCNWRGDWSGLASC